MTSIANDKLLELLNKDLSLEYTACIQYTQHQAVLKGAMYHSLQKELVVHAQEELAHATILAAQLDYLGMTPTIQVSPPLTSPHSVEMLTQDLDAENDAIARYTVRIKQAEDLGLYHLAHQLRTILAVEQEHAMELAQALGR